MTAAVTHLFFRRKPYNDLLAWQVCRQAGTPFFGFLWFALLCGVIVWREALSTGGLRLAGVIVARGVGVNGCFGFSFGLIEHLALRRVRLGAATEHFSSAYIEFLKQRLIFLYQCKHELL
ncbi:hypothetical protein D3C87_1595240 [compost metagenome]